ncbi:MAG: paraquat-inducible protein A, partial [Ignavibacteriales bacterium CG12_big_fil_rev_8_21_14_0_65_30_8]
SFFILGISLPVFASTKFFFWREDISLLKSVRILFDDGNYFLAIIILL